MDAETVNTLAIKAEPEVEDFKIENVPHETINFDISEDTKPESNLCLQLEKKEMIGNPVLNHYHSTAFSHLDYRSHTSFSTQSEAQLKCETTRDIGKMEEIVYEDWKIKNEQLDIKDEDLDEKGTRYKNIPNDVSVQLARVQNVEAIDTPDYIRIFENPTIKNNELDLKEENLEVGVMGLSEPPPLIWLKTSKERCPTEYNFCKEENVGEMDEEVDSSILPTDLSQDPRRTSKESHPCGHQTVFESANCANDQGLKCHRCNFKTFPGESLTEYHFRHNINSPEKFGLFKCCCPYTFNCSECKYQTCYKYNLKMHLLQHNMNPEDMHEFRCNNCDYRTFHKGHLKTHMLRHINPDAVKKYKCNYCDYRTFRKGHLKTHIMLRHINPDAVHKFICNDCNYRTDRKLLLKIHMLRHNINSEQIRKFKCDKCKFETFYKNSINTHLLRHINSEDVKKFQCRDCEYQTLYKGSLRIHMLRHSGDVNKFKCNNCDYWTFQKGNLKTHMLRHMNSEEVRKFKCEQCKFETNHNRSYKMHILRHMKSEDVKKIKCNDCDYRTFRKGDLKRHMLRHMNSQ